MLLSSGPYVITLASRLLGCCRCQARAPGSDSMGPARLVIMMTSFQMFDTTPRTRLDQFLAPIFCGQYLWLLAANLASYHIHPFGFCRTPVDKVAHLLWSRRRSPSSDSDPLASTPSSHPATTRPRGIMSEPTAQQNLTPQFCFSTTALRGTHASYHTPPPSFLPASIHLAPTLLCLGKLTTEFPTQSRLSAIIT